MYDPEVFDFIKGLGPSDRGELEITDVNNMYIKKGQLVGPIDKAVFTLAERELHGPIKSQFGWHLLEIKFRMD